MLALLMAASFCPPGFLELPGEACLATPAQPARQVLLYLHGMYDPTHPTEEFEQETMVRERAIARGLAVLAPRGRAGLWDWSPGVIGWLCWPTKPDQRRIGGELLARWGPAIVETLRRTRIPGAFRPALLGYSNGGFYATFVAGETKQPLRSLVVAHAGLFAGGAFKPDRAIPTLLISAEGDTAQGPRMRALHEAMMRAGWPSTFKARAGGHRLSAEDVDDALEFLSSH